MASLKKLVAEGRSRYRDGGLEGVVARREDDDWLLARGKLVHPDFTQAIDEHWRRRALEWNRVAIRDQDPRYFVETRWVAVRLRAST